ncbi:MAG: DUF4177 domain-containing protein [Bacteroidales bacterium]|nr:DUF4177 domain-containing protein [Bacteroidales bacterium]
MWEYTTLQLVVGGFEDGATADNYTLILNQYGVDGWELVSTEKYLSPLAGGDVLILFFKRLMQPA